MTAKSNSAKEFEAKTGLEISQEELNRLILLDRKDKEMKAKNKLYSQRREAERNLFVKKATEAGITVSEAEIDQYLKDHPPKSK